MPAIVRRGKVNAADASTLRISLEAGPATAAAVEAAVTPVVEELQDQIDELVVQVTTQQTIGTLELDLPKQRRGGSILVEPVGGFTEAQVGAPVLIGLSPGARPDELEGATMTFAAEVLNVRQMRVRWSAANPAPGRVSVNYIIGVRS